jgi:hypothetical protein
LNFSARTDAVEETLLWTCKKQTLVFAILFVDP